MILAFYDGMAAALSFIGLKRAAYWFELRAFRREIATIVSIARDMQAKSRLSAE